MLEVMIFLSIVHLFKKISAPDYLRDGTTTSTVEKEEEEKGPFHFSFL